MTAWSTSDLVPRCQESTEYRRRSRVQIVQLTWSFSPVTRPSPFLKLFWSYSPAIHTIHTFFLASITWAAPQQFFQNICRSSSLISAPLPCALLPINSSRPKSLPLPDLLVQQGRRMFVRHVKKMSQGPNSRFFVSVDDNWKLDYSAQKLLCACTVHTSSHGNWRLCISQKLCFVVLLAKQFLQLIWKWAKQQLAFCSGKGWMKTRIWTRIGHWCLCCNFKWVWKIHNWWPTCFWDWWKSWINECFQKR